MANRNLRKMALTLAVAVSGWTAAAHATTYTWNGNGTLGSFSNSGNWVSNSVPTGIGTNDNTDVDIFGTSGGNTANNNVTVGNALGAYSFEFTNQLGSTFALTSATGSNMALGLGGLTLDAGAPAVSIVARNFYMATSNFTDNSSNFIEINTVAGGGYFTTFQKSTSTASTVTFTGSGTGGIYVPMGFTTQAGGAVIMDSPNNTLYLGKYANGTLYSGNTLGNANIPLTLTSGNVWENIGGAETLSGATTVAAGATLTFNDSVGGKGFRPSQGNFPSSLTGAGTVILNAPASNTNSTYGAGSGTNAANINLTTGAPGTGGMIQVQGGGMVQLANANDTISGNITVIGGTDFQIFNGISLANINTITLGAASDSGILAMTANSGSTGNTFSNVTVPASATGGLAQLGTSWSGTMTVTNLNLNSGSQLNVGSVLNGTGNQFVLSSVNLNGGTSNIAVSSTMISGAGLRTDPIIALGNVTGSGTLNVVGNSVSTHHSLTGNIGASATVNISNIFAASGSFQIAGTLNQTADVNNWWAGDNTAGLTLPSTPQRQPASFRRNPHRQRKIRRQRQSCQRPSGPDRLRSGRRLLGFR